MNFDDLPLIHSATGQLQAPLHLARGPARQLGTKRKSFGVL
jgi:hypothetical protein